MFDRASHEREERDASPTRPTVVIADDVEAIRALLRHTLQDSFDILGEARDGMEAVELTATLHPDVVLLDLNMPKLDGLQAITAIRAQTPGVRIVVLTGLEPSLVEGRARDLGAADFLEKSAPLEEVHERLMALVA